ncbi:hypothetical protein AXYL_03769 [Achromobacter xylosoxidans A8]|uniref:Uncharacterized protein n=2 Tax=Alcaligenes xylosoxydans xylosoxydans TaxID=85698 RepID=E3HNQ0_ACHXA|nr:hypothetical protein AXYL_03769 [Achromobacter xylosoxidans A8]
MIQGVILIEASAEVITNRLRKRGDLTWQHSEIEVFAQKELEHAEDVCAQLGISLVRLRSPTSLEMKTALAALMAKMQIKQEHQTTPPSQSGFA